MAFLDISFPQDIAAGAVGGPERRVDIVSLSSGDEERNARWLHSRRSFDASMAIRSVDDLLSITALFEEVGAQLHSFRFKDWSDFSSSATSIQNPTANDQVIGTGDGVLVDFQLTKTYGTLTPYSRPITKPVAASVVVALDGVPQASGWSVNLTTGIVSFVAAPASGVEVTAGFLFDVPVRFDTPQLLTNMSYFSDEDGQGFGTIPEIPLIEVRE